MQKTVFKKFIELVELDQRRAQLSQELSELADKAISLDDDMAQIARNVEEADKLVYDTQKQVDALELELKVLEQAKNKTQQKLYSAANPKELVSLEHELDDLAKKIVVFDEQGLELLYGLEKAKEDAALVKADKPAKEQAKQEEGDELEKRRAHVQSLYDAYSEQRDELQGSVSDDIFERYFELKQRVPNPAVSIQRDSCTACFHGISKADVIKAEQGSVITCQGCYRILYARKALEEDESEK